MTTLFVLPSWFCLTVYALSTFKDQLTDPGNVLESWDPSLVDPCTWFHVTCNNDGEVVRVDLGKAGLSGSLVPELGQLRSLQYLELYNNDISGEMPNELGDLTSLISLDLYYNKLTGPIPEKLGKLSNLRFLRLNGNSLTGSIPTSLTTIGSLAVLDLSVNRLSGVVPVSGSFTSFTPLSFRGNPDLCYPILGQCLPPSP